MDQDTLKMLVEVISSNRNEFVYINKLKELHRFLQRNSQRKLLLKLCCVSFDELNDLCFIEKFTEFLKLPRASPWIVNMKRLIVVSHARELASIIRKEKLLSKEAIEALLQCSEVNLKESLLALSEDLKLEIDRSYLKYFTYLRYGLTYIENIRYSENNNYILFYAAIVLKDCLEELSLKQDFYQFEPVGGGKILVRIPNIKTSRILNPNLNFYSIFSGLLGDYSCTYLDSFEESWEMIFSSTYYSFGYSIVWIAKIYGSEAFDLGQLQDLLTVIRIPRQEERIFSSDQVELMRKIADLFEDLFKKCRINTLDLENIKSTANWPLYALVSDLLLFKKLKPTLDCLLLKDDLTDEVVVRSIQSSKILYPNIVYDESLFSESTVEIMEYVAWKRNPEMFERRLELAFECIGVFLDKSSQIISNI